MYIRVIFMSALLLGCTSNAMVQRVDYIVDNVQVITMNSPDVKPDSAIVIDNGKITKIIKNSDAKKIYATHRIDGKGRYLMPGLADMHVHLRWDPQRMFDLFLAHGVTTVANMRFEDGKFDHLLLRDKVRSGDITGPRYLITGSHLEEDFPASIDEVERVLDDHQRKSIDFVKIHGDLSPDIYKAIITGAKKRDIKVIGHAQHKMPLKDSLVLNSLEHMEELLYVTRDEAQVSDFSTDFLSAYRANADRLWDKSYREKVVEDVASSGIYLDPTLIVYKMVGIWQSDAHLIALRDDPALRYLPADVASFWLSPVTNPYQADDFPITKPEVDKNFQLMLLLTKELHDKGVPLLSGTDSFGTLVPGISLHDELTLLVEAGLSPFEALRCSTVNVAAYLGETGKAGVIQPGARADFILLDKNPLLDINNSRTVSGVFTQGRWLPKDLLAKLISQ